jgi:hypothetical protein
MHTKLFLALAGSISATTFAAPVPKDAPPKTAPVPIQVVPAPVPPATDTFIYDQKPISGRPVLVSPEQASSVISRFKEAYPKMGNPRVLIYVNRELVDEKSGLKLASRTEKTTTAQTTVDSTFKSDSTNAGQGAPAQIPQGGNVTIVGDVKGNALRTPGTGNITTKTERSAHDTSYKHTDKNNSTLADKQTVRDVERLFGRPLRMAGATVVDQSSATQLLTDKPPGSLTALEGEQARKDREAIAKIADVAIEVLISSRNVNVAGISGDQTYTVPDIQATAVRLKDSKVLGQTTATDIIGKDRYAGHIARNFDAAEVAEATALALMEDILLEQK